MPFYDDEDAADAAPSSTTEVVLAIIVSVAMAGIISIKADISLERR